MLFGICLLIRSTDNPDQEVKSFFLMAVVTVETGGERHDVCKYFNKYECVCRFLMITFAE